MSARPGGGAAWIVVAIAIVFVGMVGALRAEAPESGVKVGDTEARVREVLGEPSGYIGSGNYKVLIYARGKVELRDGAVTEVRLISVEEARLRREESERLRQERLAAAEAERERLRVEGEALRERKLADPVFQAASASEQLAFWTDFKRRYPDVPVAEVYTAALARRQQELDEAARQQELLNLHKQVAEAEARANEAERKAADAQRATRYVYDYGYASPFVDYYYTPGVTVRYNTGCYPSSRYRYYPSSPGRRAVMWDHDYPCRTHGTGISYYHGGSGVSYYRSGSKSHIGLRIGL